ncbi:MAG: hypothetical protein ABIM88_09145 [candidate division WOR-3 bacterium]
MVLWAKAFGGSGGESAFSSALISNGKILIAGSTTSFGLNYPDFLLIMLQPDGSVSWAKTYAGSMYDYPYSVIPNPYSGGFTIAGCMNFRGRGYDDICVMDLLPDGSVNWERVFWGSDHDVARAVVRSADGGFLIGGMTRNFLARSYDLVILKLSSDAQLLWSRILRGIGFSDDRIYSLIPTSDSGVIAVGWGSNGAVGGYDIIVLKIAQNGSMVWGKYIGTPGFDYGWSGVKTDDGGLMLLASTDGSGAGGADILILKLSPDGSPEWAKTIGGPANDYGWSMIRTNDSGYAIIGQTESFGAGGADLLLLKLGPDLSLAWASTYGTSRRDVGSSLVQLPDESLVLFATTDIGNYNHDYLVMRVEPSGGYPGCLSPCTPTTSYASLGVSPISPDSLQSFTPNVLDTLPAATDQNPSVTNVCEPVYEEINETQSDPGIPMVCLSLSGGILIRSYLETDISIYSSDGRLSYSGNLKKGESRISLGKGVYFWRAGVYRGKAVVW